MPTEIRPIQPGNLYDLVHVLNGSSAGRVFEYNSDVFSFLALSRFWNLSYEHSFLAYSDNQPAGIILNAVDPDEREAFTLYWGVLPAFRGGRVAMALMNAFFGLLQRQGYRKTHANETDETPSPIYKKLGGRRHAAFAELEAQTLPPANGDDWDIREIEIEQLLSVFPQFPGPRHWAQRPHFLRHAARSLSALGAFRNGQAEGYLVRTFAGGALSILDFRYRDESAAVSLLRAAPNALVPPPYQASFVPTPGPVYDFLRASGFSGSKVATTVTLDFSDTRSKFVRATTR